MFSKILIANRGEIAVRVIRASREMGIRTAAVFSDVDRKALHVLKADEAYPIGPAPAADSYLRIDKVIDAARQAGADAIHPGYGFLSENPELARACKEAGIVFIGPSAEAMEKMGSKTRAREIAQAAGVATVPGTAKSLTNMDDAQAVAGSIGYPVMLKASAGGGGKGMRVVQSADEMPSAFHIASSEAKNAFGDSTLYLEKYIEQPRHVEIQVLGDLAGNLVHLGERECSVQRRHQKVMEESPSPLRNAELRHGMGEAAVRVAQAGGYTNAGTVEFLVDPQRNFYFLEVNARLQVEHPVTEAVTGLDLVKLQIRIAAGEPLPFRQDDVQFRGAALECRIYAEDPANHFFPSPGLIHSLEVPSGPGVRDDSGVYTGWSVPVEYDPLISKLVTWGSNRTEAIQRMRRALDEYRVAGIKTNIGLFKAILRFPDFLEGRLDTGLLDRLFAAGTQASNADESCLRSGAIAAALYDASAEREATASNSGSAISNWKLESRRQLTHNFPPGKR